MRLFKRSPRPLVLLLGGSTGSGKSSLATEVGHRLDITRILSTDSVRHVMRAMISDKLLPSIHRSSFEVWRDVQLPPVPGLDPRLVAFLDQVRHVSVAIEAVLERAVQENLSMILEGVHLVPGLFGRFARDPRLQFVHLVVPCRMKTSTVRAACADVAPLGSPAAISFIRRHPCHSVISCSEQARRLPPASGNTFDAAMSDVGPRPRRRRRHSPIVVTHRPYPTAAPRLRGSRAASTSWS
jgi:hypothetical protein